MARGDATASVSLKADIRDLTAELKKIPGITEGEAMKMTIALEKQLKKAEKAAKDAARVSRAEMAKFSKATTEAADSTKALGSAAGDTESGLRAVAGVLGLVSPEAEKALGTVAEFGGGLEGATKLSSQFGVSLKSVLGVIGPVGIALGIAAAAYAYLAAKEKEAEEAMKASAEAATAAELVYSALSGTMQKLADDVRLVTGEIDSLGLAQEKQTKELQAQFGAQRAVLEKRVADLKAEKEALGASQRVTTEYVQALNKNKIALEASEATLAALNEREQTAVDTIDLIVYGKRAEAESRTKVTKAVRDETAAKADEVDDLSALASAYQQIEAIRSAAVDSQLSDIERVEKATRDQIAQINAITAANQDSLTLFEEAEKARVAVIAQSEAEIAAIRTSAREAEESAALEWMEEMAKASRAIADDTARQQAEVTAEIAADNMKRLDYTMSTLATMQQGAADLVDLISERNRKAALVAFRVMQGAAIAQIAVNTIVAATRALADLGPIAGAVAAGVIVASGAASAAAVAAEKPQFHSGGTPGSSGPAAPDERDVRIRANEVVETRQQAAARASGGSSSIVVVQQYKHRAFDAFIQDNTRRAASPLRQALKAGDRVGHRSRS